MRDPLTNWEKPSPADKRRKAQRKSRVALTAVSALSDPNTGIKRAVLPANLVHQVDKQILVARKGVERAQDRLDELMAARALIDVRHTGRPPRHKIE